MTAADAPSQPPRSDFDLDSDEGLEAYLEDFHARHGVPESLRYPETDEAYDRMIEKAEASGHVPAEEVEAWIRSLGTANPLPRPRPR